MSYALKKEQSWYWSDYCNVNGNDIWINFRLFPCNNSRVLSLCVKFIITTHAANNRDRKKKTFWLNVQDMDIIIIKCNYGRFAFGGVLLKLVHCFLAWYINPSSLILFFFFDKVDVTKWKYSTCTIASVSIILLRNYLNVNIQVKHDIYFKPTRFVSYFWSCLIRPLSIGCKLDACKRIKRHSTVSCLSVVNSFLETEGKASFFFTTENLITY